MRRLVRIGGALAGALVLLGAVGYCAFVPRPEEPPYHFVRAWGEVGSGPGQFREPTGIALARGEVFVSDARNGRIQVFDREGRFLRAFGRPGEGQGELGRPMNLTIRGDELYVPEYMNDRIQVFALGGTPRRMLGEPGSGPGQLDAPGGVAFTRAGNLLVADFYNQRVQEWRPDGSFVRQWGTSGETGIAAGRFNYPTDVAAGPEGGFYVADGYNDRVQAFAADGGFAHKWGGPFGMDIFGPFRGWFAVVTSVAVDAEGNVFAADFYNHRIQKFAADGTFLTSFGEEGSGPGAFDHAMAVTVAPDETVFATDLFNQRVTVWAPTASSGAGPRGED